MKIAIDVVPIRLTGEIGGAMHLVLELIKGLALKNKQNQYFLLTANWNHQFFKSFEQYGIKRILVVGETTFPTNMEESYLIGKIKRKLFSTRLGQFFRKARKLKQTSILKANNIHLLFCPMTAITYAEPGVPTISLIHDIQHEYYPQLFSSDELYHRKSFYQELVGVANKIICVSEYTKETIIEKYNYNTENIHVIHNCVQDRLKKPDQNELTEWLLNHGLCSDNYIFYPANFWPHKNHRLLLTAFNIYANKHNTEKLKLVFTGTLVEDNEDIKDAIKIMKLDKQVILLGYVSDMEISYLMAGCKYMIFPSLFEGFGIPVVEAMNFGKPVLCSNTTSLPEVGGEAPLYFDPRKPEEIVNCMEQINDIKVMESKIAIGYEQIKRFSYQKMVDEYSEVLNSITK